jgi:hypothetical protein
MIVFSCAVPELTGTIKLMTMQQQDQPTAAFEPSESGKARAAARKPPAATTRAKSTRKPGRANCSWLKITLYFLRG